MGTTATHQYVIGDTVRAEAYEPHDQFDGQIVDLTTGTDGRHWAILSDGQTQVPSPLERLTLKLGSPSDI